MYNIYPLWPTTDISALNNDGDVVGGDGVWFFNDSTYSDFGVLFNDINDKDIAVGMGFGGSVIDGPVMLEGGVLTDLSKLNGAEHAHEAYAINNNGLVCVGTEFENGGLIIDIVNSTVQNLSFAGMSNPQPYTINEDNDFAGTCMVNGNQHGFWRRGPTCADLGPVEYPPVKLNNKGTLLGAWGVTWTWDTTMSMPKLNSLDLPATAEIMSINDNGAMIGWMAGGTGEIAILFDGKNVTDLNSQIPETGWNLTQAYAINNAGQIAGAGYLNGANMGFLLDPIVPGKNPWPWGVIAIPWAGLLVVSPGVAHDGGGGTIPGGKVPPYGPPDGSYDAVIGLAINAQAQFMTDRAARTAIGVPALEAARRSITRLIAQARTPTARSSLAAGNGGLRARMRRKRIPRAPHSAEEAPAG